MIATLRSDMETPKTDRGPSRTRGAAGIIRPNPALAMSARAPSRRAAAPGPEAEPLRHRLAHQQHLAECLRSDEADEPAAGVDDDDRGRRLRLQDAQGVVQRLPIADGGDLGA